MRQAVAFEPAPRNSMHEDAVLCPEKIFLQIHLLVSRRCLTLSNRDQHFLHDRFKERSLRKYPRMHLPRSLMSRTSFWTRPQRIRRWVDLKRQFAILTKRRSGTDAMPKKMCAEFQNWCALVPVRAS
jgi:hypothetical protein